MNEIIKKEEIASGIFRLEVKSPVIAEKRRPGQFVVLRISETGERIPLTIVDSDSRAGSISLIFQAVGKTTQALALLEEGDAILDLAGPLGKPTKLAHFGRVVAVGGGLGLAPLYPIAKALKEQGNSIVSIIGARTQELLVLVDEMRAISDELHIATDDGSLGHHGFVTEVLAELLKNNEKFDLAVAIGPAPMMKAASQITKPYDLRTIVSLNSIMVDGTGMCGGCRVEVAGETKFTCVDGPEFDGHQVNFDLLIQRLNLYRNQETEAKERHSEASCKISPESKK
ncbi:MAG: ferredoxin-NADP reductase [Planctomycetes bacterium DG_23]|nr:MAG: ferredoxin-NADP reductase [Planctomycetes bacterium DG_23]